MYYIFLYTSNDENEYKSEDEDENENECLICWLPNSKNDSLKNIKAFSFIVSNCNCNALFHKTCLKDWIIKSSSCPICRKEMTIKNITCYF